METKICKACGRELPLSDFRIVKGGGHSAICNKCIAEKRAETRYNRTHMGAKQPPFSDADFDGKEPGEVWRMMCRAEKWLNSRGFNITLNGEYREVKIRKLKKE